jgi:hypothetical protein
MHLVGSVLYGADDAVRQYVSARMDGASFGNSTALGVVRDSKLIGGVVYHDGSKDDVRVAVALEPGHFFPWRELLTYPFDKLGVIRLTALVKKQNMASRRLCEALGFKMEGVHPLAIARKYTAISYGMLKDNCRWIKT